MTDELIVSAKALKEYLHQGQTLFFLELRNLADSYHEEHEWALFKVRGGLLIQSDTVERHLTEIPPDQTVIIVSDAPGDEISMEVARQLHKRGWKNIRVLDGGFKAYLEEGLPVEPVKNVLSATKAMNL